MAIFMVIFGTLLITQALTWEGLPKIPSGRRAQFFILHKDGGYEYGYDTGDGLSAKQQSDRDDRVKGEYSYKNVGGSSVDVKYIREHSAPNSGNEDTEDDGSYYPGKYGEEGQYKEDESGMYVEEQSEDSHSMLAVGDQSKIIPKKEQNVSANLVHSKTKSDKETEVSNIHLEELRKSNDALHVYSFSTGDAAEKVTGNSFSSDKDRSHNLKYVAGAGGLQPIEGSLAPSTIKSYNNNAFTIKGDTKHQGTSNAFTNNHNQKESLDTQKSLSTNRMNLNNDPKHMLDYTTGGVMESFLTTGSLAPENLKKTSESNTDNLVNKSNPPSVSTIIFEKSNKPNDASYSFSFLTDEQKREETSDAQGKVKGSYSYVDKEGSHNIMYVDGDGTGFVTTGGSLQIPKIAPLSNEIDAKPHKQLNSAYEDDGSYSPKKYGKSEGQYKEDKSEEITLQQFHISPEPSNVKETNRKTLAVPNGINLNYVPPLPLELQGSLDTSRKTNVSEMQKTTFSKNGWYGLSVFTKDPVRELSDAKEDVHGQHNFEHVAVPAKLHKQKVDINTRYNPSLGRIVTPDLPTPAIVNPPNGFLIYRPPETIDVGIVPYSPPSFENSNGESAVKAKVRTSTAADTSYQFSIDTDQYKRHETADAQGNIKGNYWYQDVAGSHDLSFVAGAETGFKPLSGSLLTAPGLTEKQLVSQDVFPQTVGMDTVGRSGNFKVFTYLPHGYGYVYDTGC